MLNQKGNLALILSLLVVLVGVGAGTYYLGIKQGTSSTISQTPNPTPTVTSSSSPQAVSSSKPSNLSDWQIYTNSKYHFTLSYPSDWKAIGVAPGAGNITLSPQNDNISISPLSQENSQMLDNLGVEVRPAKDEGGDFDNWVNSAKTSQYYKVLKESTRVVGGIKATVVEGIFGSTGSSNRFLTTTFFHTPDNNYFISIVTSDSEDKGRQEEFEKIISSLKFIK